MKTDAQMQNMRAGLELVAVGIARLERELNQEEKEGLEMKLRGYFDSSPAEAKKLRAWVEKSARRKRSRET